jgi:hypothetical protein
MISIRLPWRPRARPSATLHEIPIRSVRSELGYKCYYRPSGLSRGILVASAAIKKICHPERSEGPVFVGRQPRLRFSRNSTHRLDRHTNRFKPPADIHLGVRLAAEMPRGWAHGRGQIPFDDGELLISALDHKPMDRILTHDPANLALKFFQARHGSPGQPQLGTPPV